LQMPLNLLHGKTEKRSVEGSDFSALT